MLVPYCAIGEAQAVCRKVTLTGEVSAGQAWSAPVGDGWVFRLVPIAPGTQHYTGWDLVLEPQQGGGYPDALLLATPPYGSLNEREVGTTFGLRAQDAIAWTPRRFRFLTSGKDLALARQLFPTLTQPQSGDPPSPPDSAAQTRATAELLAMVSDPARSSAGEFAIQDAKLVPGLADPAPFAQPWAARLAQVPHTVISDAGTGSPLGELRWIRFVATLWLPGRWTLPKPLPVGSRYESAKCPQ